MEKYWERQRQEAERRSTRMDITGLKNENELLRRKIVTLENISYDDHDLWEEIRRLRGEIAEVRREIADLKQLKQEAIQ